MIGDHGRRYVSLGLFDLSDIRNQFVGGIARFGNGLSPESYDLSSFVHRLLLFEKYIFDSYRLREFPLLVEAFGLEAVMSLLDSNRLTILCDSVFIAQEASNGVVVQKEKNTDSIRIGPFSYGLGRFAYLEQMVQKEMRALDNLPGLTKEQITKLKAAISAKLVAYEDIAGHASLYQLESELAGNYPIAKIAVAKAIGLRTDRLVDPQSFSMKLFHGSDQDFYVTTNIPAACGVDESATTKAVGSGFLALGTLNLRIETMKSFQAMTGHSRR